MPSCSCKVWIMIEISALYSGILNLYLQNKIKIIDYFHCSLAKQVVTFTQQIEDLYAKEKDNLMTFECETNEPFIKVKWLKNNAEIFSGDKYRMHSDRKVHFLSVLMIEMDDDAEYTCALIEDDHIRTSGRLHVEGLHNDYVFVPLYLLRVMICGMQHMLNRKTICSLNYRVLCRCTT